MDSKNKQGEGSVEVVVPVLKVRKFTRLETRVRGGEYGTWTHDADVPSEEIDGFITLTSRFNYRSSCYGGGR